MSLLGVAQTACGSLPASYGAAAACSPNATGLRITELMVDPAGDDRGAEWIELTNLGLEPVGLDRLELSVGSACAPRRIMLQNLGSLAPQHTIVLGDGTPGEAPIDATYGALEMPNAGGHVAVRCCGVLMAAVCYGAPAQAGAASVTCVAPEAELAPAPRAGYSLVRQTPQVGPPRWVHADGPTYDTYNRGTPGAANPDGPLCQEAAGTWRPVTRPSGARVRLAAILADPVGPDTGREWLAVRVWPPGPIDLTGLVVEAHAPGHLPRRWRLEGPACAYTAGHSITLLRFFGLSGPLPPRPLPPDQWVLWGATLPNAAMQVRLGFASLRTDDIEWLDTVALPKASVGVPWARTLDCIEAGCSSGAPVAAWPEAYFACVERPST